MNPGVNTGSQGMRCKESSKDSDGREKEGMRREGRNSKQRQNCEEAKAKRN